MIYPENIEVKIDFGSIRTILQSLCQSHIGKDEVDKMQFLTDIKAIEHLLQQTAEMKALLEDASISVPHGEIHDMQEALSRIRIAGLFLDEDELAMLGKTIALAVEMERFLATLDTERFVALTQLQQSQGGKPLQDIVRMIDRVLDPYGKMRDNASPELSRIRREWSAAQGSVQKTILSILRRNQQEGLLDKEVSPTMREGRMVLPIPPGLKRKIGGIVHDESATGKTVYIEPQEVVEANNHIRSLEGEERRERIRILIEIAQQIHPYHHEIEQSTAWLGWIDFVRAKALLAIQLHAIAPHLINQPTIDWRGAKHAVLYLRLQQEGKQVVPLTIKLGRNQANRCLIISGPNAGGKSVCLKTVALLQYMMQCGLMVPMDESSTMGIFQTIMIDIGDEQSITDDLSTYSSHLRNMKMFLRYADKHSLYLIDEAGSGTEPLIGGAIAQSVITTLHQSGATGIVTTHYTNLKHLAEELDQMINGAMLYDRGAMRPLFQLSIGQAGSSFALEIAKQTGLPIQIVQQATELVGEDHIDYDKHLQDIARDKRYWENKRQNIRQREKHLEERIAYYETEIGGLKQKKKEILQQAKDEAAELLNQSNATIERTIREIKESKADKVKTQKARKQVEELKVQVGAKKEKKVMHDLRDLKALSKSLPSGQSTIQNTIRSHKLSFTNELDLRGLRADEALEQLIAYMDDAIMVGAGTVTILHGTGTGALKQLTRDYLKKLSHDKMHPIHDFHDGDPDRGGAGLTIVEI